jgi:phosphotransferase system enzyme I (PtsI)
MTLEPGTDKMLSLAGKAVSPGLAQGRAFVYKDMLQRDSESYHIDFAQIEEELGRIERALADVSESLTIDASQMHDKLGKHSADIFLAQGAILLDPAVMEDLKKTLAAEHINAEQVVRTVFRRLTNRFREMSDKTIRERGDDIEDLSRRLLRSLTGIHAHSLENLPANTVLVARRLLPSDTVFLSRSSTVAVLAEFAGSAGHAALLARELGIPCVGGIPLLFETVHMGDVVLVNGNEGLAVIHPDAPTLLKYEGSAVEVRQRKAALVRDSRNARTITLDGSEIVVRANVRSREEVQLAMDCGADGIGLFRTEPFFLSAKHFPSDKEFAEFLLDSLHPARGKHIDVRLLDIGADKNPSYLHLPPESDPFLGRRGVRVLREYPDLLEAQLRAVLEVSRQFHIGVLIPMVTTESDVAHIAGRVLKLAAEMGLHDLPRIGAMIETPAAALSIAALKKHVDFFSIGSNDLTQYTMAAGRENPRVTDYFLDDHPAVLRLIELVVREAGDVPVSLCGELAGRIDAMPSVLRTGIRSLSVSAASVPDVKNAIRRQTLDGLAAQPVKVKRRRAAKGQ